MEEGKNEELGVQFHRLGTLKSQKTLDLGMNYYTSRTTSNGDLNQ